MDQLPQLGTLYTFGYGSLAGSPELAKLIDGHRIDSVFDVRFMPMARNSLWRGKATALTVRDGGIPEYVHSKDLGNPDYKSGKPAYRVVDQDAGMPPLIERLDAGKNVAIMCVCKDTPHCHRRLIVAWAREARPGLHVVELEVDRDNPTGRKVIRDGREQTELGL